MFMGVMQMSEKERRRKAIFEMVSQRLITLVQASKQSGLSYRQTLRVYAAYLKEGDAGLIHKSRGRQSNRRHPHQEEIIARYQARYEGFGPTLASEYLSEDGFQIDHETLRKLLIKHGLWQKQRERSPYRRCRERKAQFGELVQIDGSIHDWLSEGKHSCLLNMVDDATGKTLSRLAGGETTRVVFEALWKWIAEHGIPLALYVDLKSVYVSPNGKGFSHVEVACEKLGIRIIKARSPQAKGRVERNHAVYQDRFVKELQLRHATSLEEGNRILESGFIDKLNSKFEKCPRNAATAHRALGKEDLNQVFCWEYTRQIQHDWTFSFSGICYQVEKSYGVCIKPKLYITVRKHLDDGVTTWYKGKQLSIKVIKKRPNKSATVHHFRPKKAPNKGLQPQLSWQQSNSLLFQPEPTPRPHCPLRKRGR